MVSQHIVVSMSVQSEFRKHHQRCLHLPSTGRRRYAKINMELNGKRWFCSIPEAASAQSDASLLRGSAGLQLHAELLQDLRQPYGSVDPVCAGIGICQNQAGSRASVRLAAVRFERVVDLSEETPDSG